MKGSVEERLRVKRMITIMVRLAPQHCTPDVRRFRKEALAGLLARLRDLESPSIDRAAA